MQHTSRGRISFDLRGHTREAIILDQLPERGDELDGYPVESVSDRSLSLSLPLAPSLAPVGSAYHLYMIELDGIDGDRTLYAAIRKEE